MLIAAVTVPEANGLKVTEIMQLALAASDEPQLLVSVKLAAFVPVIVMERMVSAIFPPLVSLTP
jgi:hypothetical protein